MPSCSECGIDIPKEGLCPECQARKDKESKQTDKPGKKPNILPIIIISGVVAVAIIFGIIFMLSEASGNVDEPRTVENTEDNTSNGNDSSNDAANDTDTNQDQTGTEPEEIKPFFDITTRPEGPSIDDYNAYIDFLTSTTGHEEKYLKMRWDRAQFCRGHLNPPDLTIERVIQAFLRTPREYFCREENIERAYESAYMPIGWGQTISGPNIVARMTNAINPPPDHKVLEIGTGSGYQSAFLAELSNFVYTIEIIEPLALVTEGIYQSLEDEYPQYKNVKRKIADGYYGWEEYAPFDRIIVTCGIDHIPPPLLQQLAPDGIMVIPVGPPWQTQEILKITKVQLADGSFTIKREDIYEGTGLAGDVFVPFTAEGGDAAHSKDYDNIQE
jgi:protein-L-isoaspartate(D-aspartate) O-methyltransferase